MPPKKKAPLVLTVTNGPRGPPPLTINMLNKAGLLSTVKNANKAPKHSYP